MLSQLSQWADGMACCAAEYVFDNSWASSYHRTGQSYYPKLQVGVAGVLALLKPGKTVCKPEKTGCGHTAPLPVVWDCCPELLSEALARPGLPHQSGPHHQPRLACPDINDSLTRGCLPAVVRAVHASQWRPHTAGALSGGAGRAARPREFAQDHHR